MGTRRRYRAAFARRPPGNLVAIVSSRCSTPRARKSAVGAAWLRAVWLHAA